MSGATVYAQMSDHNTALLEKICENDAFASVIMGLLTLVIRICEMERGKPIEGITFEPWSVNGENPRRFTSKFSCSSLKIPTMHKWDRQFTFARYVGQRAGMLAKSLSDAPRLNDWLEELVNAIANYAKDKGYRFSELEFSDHLISKEDVVILGVKKAADVHV